MAPAPSVPPKLARLSRVMAALSVAGMVVLPVMVAAAFLYPDSTQWMMFNISHTGADLTNAIPIQYRVDALVCEIVPLGLVLWALWSLAQVFARYAKGDVFSAEPLRHLHNVARALFLGVLADFLMQAPISYLLNYWHGPGHREISLSFGTEDAARLFIAGAVLVIARVMAEARRVADENAGFV
ncbi:MAG TPA: DUF2975 domain-containing protein [Rhizomicrobium sp.]|nr:DUF2975 domain-containing protein [Rhizomicrobium sp.]